jgi:hypothetical protein
MTLESATPKKRWNPPLAEISPILIALLIKPHRACRCNIIIFVIICI